MALGGMLCAERDCRRVLGPGWRLCTHPGGSFPAWQSGFFGGPMRRCCVAESGLRRRGWQPPVGAGGGLRVPDEELTKGLRWQTAS